MIDELKKRSTGLIPSGPCEDGEGEMAGTLSIDESV